MPAVGEAVPDGVAQQIAGLVRIGLPEMDVHSVAAFAQGADHGVYVVNGDVLVRTALKPGPGTAADVRREAAVLEHVGALSPFAVPHLLFSAPEQGALAYRALPGTPLVDVDYPSAAASPIGAQLGRLLGSLHGAPIPPWAGEHGLLVESPPSAEWLADAAALWARIESAAPEQRRLAVQGFLHSDPPPPAPHEQMVLSHNDLGSEHVLVDPVTMDITGIIDWTDAAVVDPAFDLGLILRDLGPRPLYSALAAYRASGAPMSSAGLRERALFYGRCVVLEDLAEAVDSGRSAALMKAARSMEWLFPG